MKPVILLLLSILLFSTTSCKKDPEPPKQPQPINLAAKGQEVIKASNDFGVDLFRLTALDKPENMMLSPLSASAALTMLLNGCNSETYEQIRDMLGFEGLTLDEINTAYSSLVSQLLNADPKVNLALANAVFYRQDFSFRQDYLDKMNQSFDANIEGLDFLSPAALETINNWASDNTNGKIDKVLTEIDPLTVMFLMNALYFKGTWTYQFKPEDTYTGTFYLDDGTETEADMMFAKLPVRSTYSNDYQALELQYGSGNFSMVIVVPGTSLHEYLEGFNAAKWESVITGLDAIELPVEMDISLPKFKFEYEKQLKDQLRSLGMIDAFDENAADLSGISDEQLFVQFVKQNSFIEVNEEGTEAAAVTTIGIGYTSVNEFTVSKPFIFAIRERTTNTILFIGKVENPES